MKAETLTFRTEPEPFWSICQMRGDDGYDRIEVARRHGWEAIPGWGRDGWDLGSWPLVVIFHRERDGRYELAENVEGDVAAYSFPSREERDRTTDELAFYHWKHECEEWVVGIETADDMPDHLRGPYSRKRAAAV